MNAINKRNAYFSYHYAPLNYSCIGGASVQDDLALYSSCRRASPPPKAGGRRLLSTRVLLCRIEFDVIGDALEPSLCQTVSEIFNGECDAMVDMTLI